MNRLTVLVTTLLLTGLLVACGGDDDGDSEGDAGGQGDDGGAASTSLVGDDATRVTSDDGDLVLVVPDGAPEVSATKTGTGWELSPDGATFDEPLVIELEVAVSGNGLPLAILESADGTRELPVQVAEIQGGRAMFRVLVSHFSELSVFEAELASTGDDGAVALEESADIARLLEGPTPLDRMLAAIDDSDFEDLKGSDTALSELPAGPVRLFAPSFGGASPLDNLQLEGARYALAPTGWALVNAGGSDQVGGSGDGGANPGGSANPAGERVPLPTLFADVGEGVEDISSGLTVTPVDGGVIVDFSIPTRIDHEDGIRAGGQFLSAITADIPGGFIESSIGSAANRGARAVVFDRSGVEQDKQSGLPHSLIDGGETKVFFPISVAGGQPTGTVNDQAYPLSGMRIDAWLRDAEGQNAWVGSALIDLDALAKLAS